jgi:high-affinity nickel-transport protein
MRAFRPFAAAFAVFDDDARHLRRKLIALCAMLIAANALAWVWAIAALRGNATLLATALIAYGFGLRHAVDADHIAAIDNVTRKLMQEGKHPITTGFFFALGHSTVVLGGSVVIALSTASVRQRFPGLVEVGGLVGTSVSALFLLIIATVNVGALISVYRVLGRTRRGERNAEEQLNAPVAQPGLLGRLFRTAFRLISRSWHMYPLGFLFGLGFDTATEIGLLGIAAAEAARGLSIWSILVFAALFAAGMSLVDTSDGVLMIGAYGWAFKNPARKLYYNLTITAISVLAAAVVAIIETCELVADKLGSSGGVWEFAIGHLGVIGYLLIGISVVTWLASYVIGRAARWRKIGSAGSSAAP